MPVNGEVRSLLEIRCQMAGDMNINGYLVLDTNIWVYSTRLLSTPLGAAVIYSLSQSKRVLALPEVIEEEIKKHTCKRGIEAVSDIRANYRLIEQLMGSRDDFRVPSDNEFICRVDSRLSELNEFIYRTEFKLNHAKSALHRVLEESPPNGYKNQQFKDSAIWESILELAKDVDVDFVTEDKAFFKDSKPSNGLASNLLEDCKKVSGKIRVFYQLPSYLDAIKEELPSFNKEIVAEKINDSIIADLSQRAVDKGYKLGNISKSEIQVFLTEKPDVVAIEFEINYMTHEVVIPESEIVVEASLVVKGDCGYNIVAQEISDVKFDNIKMVTKEGESIPSYGNIFLAIGTAYQGRRTIPYSLREPLE